MAAKTECKAGLTYEDDRLTCSPDTGELEDVFAACRANGTYVSVDDYAGPCTGSVYFGYEDVVCYNCDGFRAVCGPPNSSCEELLGDSTASSSALASLGTSDLLLRVAAAFCGIELLCGLAWY